VRQRTPLGDYMTLRLGVVGCGGVAQLVHLPAAKRVEGADLVCLCDAHDDVVKKVAAKHGVPRCYTSTQEMYAREEIDAVLVLTSHPQHMEVTVEAAEAGKHVLVEKPMAMTPQECKTMISACRRNDVFLMAAFMKRFDPSLMWVKDSIDRGQLGSIFVVNSWYCDSLHHMSYAKGFIPSFIKPEKPIPSLQAPVLPRHKHLMLGHGSHPMDLLHWIGGEVRSVTTAYRETGPLAYVSTTLLDFAGGSSGFYQLAGFLARDWAEGLTVHGTEGSAEVDIPFPYFKTPSPARIYTKAAGVYSTIAVPYRDQYLGEIQHFVDCVTAGQQPSPSGQDGLYAQRMVDAACKSAVTGRRVRI
jgi:predicted dehydrogenase